MAKKDQDPTKDPIDENELEKEFEEEPEDAGETEDAEKDEEETETEEKESSDDKDFDFTTKDLSGGGSNSLFKNKLFIGVLVGFAVLSLALVYLLLKLF